MFERLSVVVFDFILLLKNQSVMLVMESSASEPMLSAVLKGNIVEPRVVV